MELTIKKSITSIMTAFFLITVSLEAQVLLEQDLFVNPSELLIDKFTELGNSAYIQQLGNTNDIQVLQLQNGVHGNLTKILQSGDWNIALVSQEGQQNQLALIQQGNLNLFELVNDGSENKLVSIQHGGKNTILQELIKSNQISSELVQIGNENEIFSVIEGLNNKELKIRQMGDGMKVVIRQSGL